METVTARIQRMEHEIGELAKKIATAEEDYKQTIATAAKFDAKSNDESLSEGVRLEAKAERDYWCAAQHSLDSAIARLDRQKELMLQAYNTLLQQQKDLQGFVICFSSAGMATKFSSNPTLTLSLVLFNPSSNAMGQTISLQVQVSWTMIFRTVLV